MLNLPDNEKQQQQNHRDISCLQLETHTQR